MASKVEALVRNFLRTDSDSLYLVPGEKIFVMKGSSKSVVGREDLSEESFNAVAWELVPGATVQALAEMKHRVPFRVDEVTPPVEIVFGMSGTSPAMMMFRKAAAAPSPATAPPARRPEPPPTVVAPRVRPAAGPPSTGPIPLPHPAAPDALDVPEELGGITADETSASSTQSRPKKSFRSKSGRGIDDILVKMLEAEASDVHLSSGTAPVFRIHGEMTPQLDLGRLSSEDVEKLLNQVLSERHKKEFADRNDTDFAYEIEGAARFRVNVFRDRNGVGGVFRQIPIEIRTVKDLNLPPAVVRLGDLSKGLVLVTGPTGSGKSTTLAAIVDYINETRTEHIITIEDPIEFVHQNKKCLLNQREVGSHTRGFKEALRAALREDPDIVLVGEMRDLETVAIAIETAETGHLVFGTLHTTTATSTVDRIVDQFPADRQQQIRVMLAESLKGVVAQTLLRKIGGGRVAALEVLLSNNAVQNLIRDGKTFQLPSILQTSRAQGMVLLNDSLMDFVKRGLVEPREAYLKAVDKLGLLSLFKTNNVTLPTESAGAAEPAAAPQAPAAPGVTGPRVVVPAPRKGG